MSSLAAQKQAAFLVLKISLMLMIFGLMGLSFDLPAASLQEVVLERPSVQHIALE